MVETSKLPRLVSYKPDQVFLLNLVSNPRCPFRSPHKPLLNRSQLLTMRSEVNPTPQRNSMLRYLIATDSLDTFIEHGCGKTSPELSPYGLRRPPVFDQPVNSGRKSLPVKRKRVKVNAATLRRKKERQQAEIDNLIDSAVKEFGIESETTGEILLRKQRHNAFDKYFGEDGDAEIAKLNLFIEQCEQFGLH